MEKAQSFGLEVLVSYFVDDNSNAIDEYFIITPITA